MTTNFATILREQLTELDTERTALLAESDALLASLTKTNRSTTPAEDKRLNVILARAGEIKTEREAKIERIAELDAIATERAAVPKSPNFIRDQFRDVDRSLWDVDVNRLAPADLIGQAERAIDATHRRGLDRMPVSAFDKATTMLRSSSSAESSRAAEWLLVASDPAYESAFAKIVVDPTRGHLEWTTDEQRAYARANQTSRAMSLNTTSGGYLVPFSLDPAILLTNAGSNNPLRSLATVKQTTSNSWHGITSAGATAEWHAEAGEVGDGSPTLAQPSIPMFTGDSFIPYSFEFGMDAVDALNELARILIDSADNLMATAYTTGNGTTAPAGIITGLSGTSSKINTLGSEALAATDPYALQNALPARFSANATFQCHIATANTYRQMETASGALKFPELRYNPASLLGKPWFENSNMDGTIDAAATADNFALLYGDVAAGFVIVDRIGAQLELIPNLVGTTNNRPTGQRGALLWFRTGSKVVIPEALRLLDVPTAA